jgi:hypothetical protein
LVTVDLLGRAEALLPTGHRDADLVSAEVVQALLRAGKVAEASTAESCSPVNVAEWTPVAPCASGHWLSEPGRQPIRLAQESLDRSARLLPPIKC